MVRKEVPNLQDVEINLQEPEHLVHKAVVAACARLLPGWAAVTAESCEFSSISGGISNLSVKVVPRKELGLSPVAVKVFGDKTDLLVDRERERSVLLYVNAAGFGAKVLGTFANGRIESFLSCEAMTPQQMCSAEFVPGIAAQLRRFHDLQVGIPRRDHLFPCIHGWMQQVRKLTFTDEAKRVAFEKLDLSKMESEIAEMEKLCAAANSPLVFSHNDLLSGNILFLTEDTNGEANKRAPLQLIDFEYSAYGPRGFDFGNHFNEYAGFECDYTRYPNAEAQKLFFKHYLLAGGDKVEDAALDRMVAEANLFALASHIYWAVWSLVQARYSPIDFDYLGYSGLRWDEYYRRKEEFVAGAKEVLLTTSAVVV